MLLGKKAVEAARKAWDRGDMVYLHSAFSATVFFKREHQRRVQEDLNAIAALGWVLQGVTPKVGYRVFTFVRPTVAASGTA